MKVKIRALSLVAKAEALPGLAKKLVSKEVTKAAAHVVVQVNNTLKLGDRAIRTIK